MAIENINENVKWWSELKHGGMLISPALVGQYFENIEELSTYKYNQLRDKYITFDSIRASQKDITKIDTEVINKWVDYIIQIILDHNPDNISKGKNIDSRYKLKTILGQSLSPDRVIFSDASRKNPILLVSIQKSEKIGIGKDRKSYTEFIELLRGTGVKLGLITNGVQFRLCYSGIDYDAWTEWDSSMWFIEAEWRKQLDGFIALLGKDGLQLVEGENTRLKTIIEESRNKQSEISDILGQQIREAVEILINQLDSTVKTYPELLESITKDIDSTQKSDQQINSALYQASSRIVMRMVVLLFAEARNLLPRDIVEYNQSYGIEGLFEQLKMALAYESKLNMKNQYSAWRRIISLFNLVHEGSTHQTINLQGYGGILFERGNLKSEDEILQCIAIFENMNFKLNDYQVYELLEKIKVGKLKVKQGNKNVWVKGPVDFSDLRTEYIGIMYEGLLDYSLKRATEPLIVVNIGSQPILPLSHLEGMSDKEIKDLMKNLKKDSKSQSQDVDTSEGDITSRQEIDEEDDLLDEVDKRAKAWALRVVELEKKVKKSKSMDGYTYNKACEKEADKLVIKILHEGEYYIASQGGTRKGSGTFYTKPGLAVPTTQRTLKPLLYDIDSEGNDIPKKPKEILNVKVCDPTCGSGAFLVAATDYITDALTKSILYYGSYTSYYNTKTRVLPFGKSSKGNLDEELISVPPDDPKFEEYLRANLMRHVVERCIYGVDINPMAVELAKLALWINTMNTELPFTFLDHKIKVGNGLVGTWFDQFKHYPILAWNREGGDKDHSNGVHYKKGEWTKNLKEFMDKKVKPDMVRFIENLEGNNQIGFDAKEDISNKEIEEALEKAIEALNEFNDLPMSASGMRAKEEVYKNKILNNKSIKLLKEVFDEWCALWFWPADELDEDVPMPMNFHNISDKAKERVKRIAREIKFFHWELEFPDVFANKDSGFTIILGNPPWDIIKTNSQEFFISYNPIYRTYEKQDAINEQSRLFERDKQIERLWLKEKTNFKSTINWISNVSKPYGNGKTFGTKNLTITKPPKKNDELHEIWSSERIINSNDKKQEYPYIYQGGGGENLNKYRLFSEVAFMLLKIDGRLGFIVPSNIYSDKGTKEIRDVFMNHGKLEWVFSFENKNKIFDIHSSSKFCVLIVQKTKTKNNIIKSAFMQHKLENWINAENRILNYPVETIYKFSPNNLTILETECQQDIDIITKVYDNSVALDKCCEIEWTIDYYAEEFNMTHDSKLFIPSEKLIDEDIKDIGFGRYKLDEDVILPLYQGAMMWQYDFAYQKFEEDWKYQDFRKKDVIPKNYMLLKDYFKKRKPVEHMKVVARKVQSTTNERTKVVSVIPDYPTGNSLAVINSDKPLVYVAIANSFVFDFILRKRMSQNNVSMFYLLEMPIPIDKRFIDEITIISAKLSIPDYIFADKWIVLKNIYKNIRNKNWYSLWALTDHERLRLRCILDAVVAEMYGLDYEDLAWILKDDQSDPKGFWRVDKDKPLNMRHTTLTLVAFKRLKEIGIEAFLKEDWQLPEDVAEAMGPRFLDWQFGKSVEESWKECEEHARAFLGDEEYEEFIKNLDK
ncbi:methyltransferase [[Clostridium] sordellii]|uniref:Eco57I restriction-modification methylase domain-containing protein n=1 Tax=Paraclostridium sordellii TaxID=1505 RepID=UPI0005E1692F|nr:Eco57I restriction-modification methylase domain-containing protein [Paeniclostridium sordellii]CEN89112.1 methyltransferase [[Clostridium] sordellii] [Paeniclostridium sordellii]